MFPIKVLRWTKGPNTPWPGYTMCSQAKRCCACPSDQKSFLSILLVQMNAGITEVLPPAFGLVARGAVSARRCWPGENDSLSFCWYPGQSITTKKTERSHLTLKGVTPEMISTRNFLNSSLLQRWYQRRISRIAFANWQRISFTVKDDVPK